MGWNTFLALVGLVSGYGVMKSKRPTTRSMASLLFILFMPNTIYMVTDLIHIPRQITQVYGFAHVLLITQYAVLVWLALVTYLKSMQWFEQGAFRARNVTNRMWWWHRNTALIMVILNFATAMAVVMGRVLRTNSWYAVTQPERVVGDIVAVLSDNQLLAMSFFAGILLNAVYFSFRKQFNFQIRAD
jgi:uncharacterized membrane protein